MYTCSKPGLFRPHTSHTLDIPHYCCWKPDALGRAQRIIVLLITFIGLTTVTAEAAPRSQVDPPVVTSYLNAEQALIRIETEGGDYVEFGETEARTFQGSGTGFLVDPSGIAVTNNHVVTGAGVLYVYRNDSNQRLRAHVLGASECADLAVLQIVGSEFPYLTWGHELFRGMDVFSIGYPLGTTEPTINDGIISALKADGQTTWSSLDEILLHSAVINPGNSGGPLINRAGEVVGVNYAQNERNQYFAIRPADAIPLIEQLRQGLDVDSIGINGEAFLQESDFSGIWVHSVKAGSPAERAGIRAGDILTSLASLRLAQDGTMKVYCDILRSHTADETVNVSILRPVTGEACEGQLNGRQLTCAAVSIANFRAIQDPSGQIMLETPTQWREMDWKEWRRNGRTIGILLDSAPDLASYTQSWNSPGFSLGISTQLARQTTVTAELNRLDLGEACTHVDRVNVAVGPYSGMADIWEHCGGGDNIIYRAVFMPQNQSFLGLLFFQITTEREQEIMIRLLETLEVVIAATPTAAPPTATPRPTATATPIPQPVTATVLVPTLNVRTGPDTHYDVIAVARQNQTFAVIGQADSCAWVMIEDRSGQRGWFATRNQYAQVNGDCSAVGSGEILPTPTNAPVGSPPVQRQQASGDGCITFQNQLNAELTITFTGQRGQGSRDFRVAAHGAHRQCFTPGPYTYTLDAPPPWGSTNGSLDVTPGMNIAFPIGARN